MGKMEVSIMFDESSCMYALLIRLALIICSHFTNPAHEALFLLTIPGWKI